jgi:hypothetical protein
MKGSGMANTSPYRVLKRYANIAGQLQMLFLIVTDRHLIGLVEQDVGGHQHRIVEQADVDVILVALRLVLELVIRERVRPSGV